MTKLRAYTRIKQNLTYCFMAFKIAFMTIQVKMASGSGIDWRPPYPRATTGKEPGLSHGEYQPNNTTPRAIESDDDVPLYYSISAGVISWLLLASFLLSPASYTSTRYLDTLGKTGAVGRVALGAIRNIPLAAIAAAICIIATACLGVLWWRWRHNVAWVNRCIMG